MGKNQNKEEDDPYSAILDTKEKLTAPEVETARARKWRILQQKAKELTASAKQGAIMGSLVGGGFGFIIGCWSAVQSRSLMIIPLSTIISGASFGFFMACGTMIRSDDQIPIQFYQKYGAPNKEYWMNKYK